jgi:hypothetical protein
MQSAPIPGIGRAANALWAAGIWTFASPVIGSGAPMIMVKRPVPRIGWVELESRVVSDTRLPAFPPPGFQVNCRLPIADVSMPPDDDMSGGSWPTSVAPPQRPVPWPIGNVE